MAEDVLSKLSTNDVAAFYSRLADSVDARKGALKVSLAATMMRLWLQNRNPTAEIEIEAPEHLQNHEQTVSTMTYHRQVFLTEKRARRGSEEVWAGIVPRLSGNGSYPKWDINRLLTLEYESLTEIPLRYQITGNDADRDILYALHGFQLHSKVVVAAQPIPAPRPGVKSKVRILFQSFEAYAWDTYDWDYSEHLTVPNPDYGSTAKGAVETKSQTVVVYHRNAKRIEDAGLAAPYRFRTKAWRVADAALVAPAEIDPSRSV